MDYTIPKGVFDILPLDPDPENSWRNSDRWQHIEKIIRETCNIFGYKEIRTPIFERTELFVRGVGEGSDIVTKEMYTFLDKGERSMTLRPEGTASVMRAFVEKKLYNQATLHKYFYIGPMFRYERPQAGRYRQHHQFGAEALGASSPEQDAELIYLVCSLYKKLGLKNLKVLINNVGSKESRASFMAALKSFLEPHIESLSADSKVRFSKNVLRILDSKDLNDQSILANAPSILDFVSEEENNHFQSVCRYLDSLNISYEISPKLVRGLDYYNKTVFEITTSDLGAQNSIGGGGRYDGLTETLGGPHIPSVGFATGLERVLQTMDRQGVAFPEPSHPQLFFIPMGDMARTICFQLMCQMRDKGISCDIDMSGKKIQHGIQLAVNIRATYCVVVGDQELDTGVVKLKNLTTRETTDIKLNQIIESFIQTQQV
jgi:histidyl-tRNA synthetase